MSSFPLLGLERVSVDRDGRRIINDVSFEVVSGEVFALVGPNGAGKSTLLGTLSGEIAPSAGRATLAGKSVGHYRAKALSQQRAILLQSNQVSFPFQVSQVVWMGRNPWAGTDQSAHDSERIAEAMAAVGIEQLAHRRFNELSGGERARVSLARVLAQDTEVVLLDEPTAALDLHHQDRVMRVIRERSHANRAMVVVIHDLSLAAAYADRVALIVDGSLRALGAPRDVMTPEILSDAYRVTLDVIDAPDGSPLIVPVRPPRS